MSYAGIAASALTRQPPVIRLSLIVLPRTDVRERTAPPNAPLPVPPLKRAPPSRTATVAASESRYPFCAKAQGQSVARHTRGPLVDGENRPRPTRRLSNDVATRLSARRRRRRPIPRSGHPNEWRRSSDRVSGKPWHIPHEPCRRGQSHRLDHPRKGGKPATPGGDKTKHAYPPPFHPHAHSASCNARHWNADNGRGRRCAQPYQGPEPLRRHVGAPTHPRPRRHRRRHHDHRGRVVEIT